MVEGNSNEKEPVWRALEEEEDCLQVAAQRYPAVTRDLITRDLNSQSTITTTFILLPGLMELRPRLLLRKQAFPGNCIGTGSSPALFKLIVAPHCGLRAVWSWQFPVADTALQSPRQSDSEILTLEATAQIFDIDSHFPRYPLSNFSKNTNTTSSTILRALLVRSSPLRPSFRFPRATMATNSGRGNPSVLS